MRGRVVGDGRLREGDRLAFKHFVHGEYVSNISRYVGEFVLVSSTQCNVFATVS